MTRLDRRRHAVRRHATTPVDLAQLGTGTGFVRVEEAIPAELPTWDGFDGHALTGRTRRAA
ncbi:hypothetical protein [Paractinoplanes maris]|uniref:hypothetical protein n=1 Tax=Paractinoplanes maris TaxID=1734446 RepID=UPI00202212CF|nr:hypothetical protein [Actinoplanes maris]